MQKSDGFSSFSVLTLILFIAGLLLYATSFAHGTNQKLKALDDKKRAELKAHQITTQVIDLLLKENNADSEFDDVWSLVDELNSDQIKVELVELSGNLNPNFDALSFWEDDELEKEWKSLRLTLPASDREEMDEYIGKKTGYSLYSYINILTTDEEVLRAYLERHGYGSESMSELLALESPKQSEVNDLLIREGAPYSLFLTVYPQVNVNSCSVETLDALLGQNWEGQPLGNAHIIRNRIIMARKQGEIKQSELPALLECDEEIRVALLQYMGTISWFWKISIETEETLYEYIFCRIPPVEEESQVSAISIISLKETPL